MTSYHGLVTGVKAQTLGDSLSVAAVAGDTVLHVYDTADFDEDGGWLLLPGIGLVPNVGVLPYTTIDDDASTITLAGNLPAPSASPVDAEVQVWDAANTQPAVVYKAIVDSLDGFDGDPIEAVVDQGLAHALSQSMRDGTGESVTLVRDGSELRVAQVHGRRFALAALQYLQGGMTTRQSEDAAGVDILGVDSGTPGVYLYDTGGVLALQITDDLVAGVIKFYTGIAGEAAGFLNPSSVSSIPTVTLNSGTTPARTAAASISLLAGTGGANQVLVAAATTQVGGRISLTDATGGGGVLALNGAIASGVTISGAGAVTITHGLSTAPTCVLITPVTSNRFFRITSVTATQFVLEVHDSTNTLITTGTCSFHWLVYTP